MPRTLDPAAHALRRDAFVDAAQRLIQTKGYEQMSSRTSSTSWTPPGRLLPLLRFEGGPARSRGRAHGRRRDGDAATGRGRSGSSRPPEAGGCLLRHHPLEDGAEGPDAGGRAGLALGRERGRAREAPAAHVDAPHAPAGDDRAAGQGRGHVLRRLGRARGGRPRVARPGPPRDRLPALHPSKPSSSPSRTAPTGGSSMSTSRWGRARSSASWG
jgi:hypothetical protein